jgi:hypothetical protein
MADHNIISLNSSFSHDSLLEQDLTAYGQFRGEKRFRFDCRTIWSSYDLYLTVIDYDPPVRFPIRNPFWDMWNKPTCFYFEPSFTIRTRSALSLRYKRGLAPWLW